MRNDLLLDQMIRLVKKQNQNPKTKAKIKKWADILLTFRYFFMPLNKKEETKMETYC